MKAQGGVGGASGSASLLSPGSRIDRYVVLGLLGKGGMGVVYKTYDAHLNRGVALKFIQVDHKPHGKHSGPSARLLREAQALARLNHPNVVRVHNVGTLGENVFVAMELVEGKTLRAWYKESAPSMTEALEVMRAAGRGLAAAHRAGIVHRDFKPANVIVGADARVRVIDFGLARAESKELSPALLAQQELEWNEHSSTGAATLTPTKPAGVRSPRAGNQPPPEVDDSSETPLGSSGKDFLSSPLTCAGSIVGTPMYMAPEQYLGGRIDARADQFGFCVALYEILYGKRPFSGSSLQDIATQITNGSVQPRPKGTDVPDWLHDIVLRGLSKHPTERYASMDELLEELQQDPEEVRSHQQTTRRRRLAVMGSAVLAIAVPLGLWFGLRVRTAQLCQTVEGELVGVWDAATKEAIHAAFLGTKRSFAEDTWVRVEPALDDYTAEWRKMRRDVCYARWLTATEPEEVFDLRMTCLSRRLRELRALAGVFAEADARVVAKAVPASSSLADVKICADQEALRAPYPPPKTAEAKAQVEAIRERLAKVKGLRSTGKYSEGLELAQRLEAEASGVTYAPLQSELLFELGRLLEAVGEYERAETTLYDAARVAGESMDGLLAAAAMAAVVRVVGHLQARYPEGLLVGRSAEVVLGLGGGDDDVRSLLLNNVGVIFWSMGDFDQAMQHIRESLALRQQAKGSQHPDVAASLNNIGLVLWEQGYYEKALEYHRRSLAMKEKTLGSQHPDAAFSLGGMGDVFRMQGEYEKALEYQLKALAIREDALGSEHPIVTKTLNAIGLVFTEQGKYDQSLEYHRKVLAIRERVLGPEHPEVAMSLNNMGFALKEKGEYGKALEYHSRSLAMFKKTLGSEHRDVGRSLANMGDVFLKQGDYEQAEQFYESALRNYRGALGDDHRDLVSPSRNMGAALYQQGEYDQALAYYREAVRIQKKALGSEHPALARSLDEIGSLFYQQSEYEKALAYYRESVRIREKALGPEDPALAWSLNNIGHVLVEQGMPERALGPLERAAEICDKKACDPRMHARGLFDLARALLATNADLDRCIKLAKRARQEYANVPNLRKEVEEVNAWL